MRRTNTIFHLKIPKTFYSLLCLSFFCSSLCFAQGWERTFGGQWQEGGNALLQTSTGDYLLAGYSNSFSAGDNDLYIVKTDANGNELWSKTYERAGIDEAVYLQQLGDDFIIAGKVGGPSIIDNNIHLLRIDTDGNIIWEKSFGDSLNQECNGLAIASDNSIFITTTGDNKISLQKYDPNGSNLWTKDWAVNDTAFALGPQTQLLTITPDDHIGMLVSLQINPPSTNLTPFLYKMDLNGDTLWTRNLDDYSIGNSAITATQNNGFALSSDLVGFSLYDSAGSLVDSFSYGGATFLLSTVNSVVETANGDFAFAGNGLARYTPGSGLQWTILFDNSAIETKRARMVLQTTDGGFSMVGVSDWQLNSPSQMTLLHTDANGNLYTNFVTGNVFMDQIDNCAKDTSEKVLPLYTVKASGSRDFYGITDAQGNYQINLDTGAYQISITSNSPYLDSCDPAYPVQLSTFGDTVYQDIPMEILAECPGMNISMSTPRLRRCFDNSYFINYCNFGSVAADSAYATIELDSFLSLNSASIPFTDLGNNNYRFDLGMVDIGECNSFSLNVYVSCDALLGQSHCSTARIFPDTICTPTNPEWSGASVSVKGRCTQDSVIFVLKNVGSGNMTMPSNYIVIEDVVMYMSEPFQLPAGDSLRVGFPANGSTYQMIAGQVNGHPGNSNPLAAIEGCVSDSNMVISTGFVGTFPLNEEDPTIDIDCTANIGAYDPNDKQGFPVGFGDDHMIKPNTSLDYLIRFQNTGTDTAFTVVVRDTITDYLNMETFQMLNSSHAYELDIEGSNILVFTFNNIHLPDSNVNEPASHGFIKFKIGQQADLPDGTFILNKAAIYFDFNEPIITNETSHLVDRNFLDLVPIIEHPEYGRIHLRVFPNPSQDNVYLEIDGAETLELQFQLYDTSGRQLQRRSFDQGQMVFERNGLPSGMYFYRVEHNGTLINSGKIILH